MSKKGLGIVLLVASLLMLLITNLLDSPDLGYWVGSVLIEAAAWGLGLGLTSYLIWRFSAQRYPFLFILGVLFVVAATLELFVTVYQYYVNQQLLELMRL
jgi:hypothetical protein